MRRALVLAAVLLVAARCGSGPGPASPPGSSPASGSPGPSIPSVPSSPPPTAPPTDPPTTAPSDPPPSGEPPEPDPAAFLQVCWNPDAPLHEPPIPCADAVLTALIDPALAGAVVPRVDVRFGCPDAAPCPSPDPDVAWVTAIAGDRPVQLEITRGPDGGLAVTEVGPGSRTPAPSFVPPATGLAALPDAPASLADREPYPLCGVETAPMGGPYDEAARTCFLTGVLAGSSVEFASIGSGTEGRPFVVLYRHGGTGGIEQVFGEAGAWVRSWTGIGTAGGGLVFDVDGLATAREPVP